MDAALNGGAALIVLLEFLLEHSTSTLQPREGFILSFSVVMQRAGRG
jgi:hypothetical protein